MPAEATSSPFCGPVLPTPGFWELSEAGHTSTPPPPPCLWLFSDPRRILERSCVLRSVPTCLVGDPRVMPPKPAHGSRLGAGSWLGTEKRSGWAASSGHPCRQRAGSSFCEAPRLQGWSGGDLAMWKPRCSSSLQPSRGIRDSTGHCWENIGVAKHLGRCVKRRRAHFQAQRASRCLSPGSPAPGTGWQALGERKVHVGGSAVGDSQRRREGAFASNPGS